MPRYKGVRKFANSMEFYEFLRFPRNNSRAIVQYETIKMRNPTIRDRSAVPTAGHIWKYGDRYYNLAFQHYGDPNYWWVIAWWNSLPTEAHVRPGMTLMVPLDLEAALKALGAD